MKSSPPVSISVWHITEAMPSMRGSPAGWVVPLPGGLSFDAMALGTAGFLTAALGVVRMEDNGLCPEMGR